MCLGLLALGTANNIGDSLGLQAAPQEAIAAWAHQHVVNIDAGIIQDAVGESRSLKAWEAA